MSIDEQIGFHIEQRRNELGLTREKLANISGYDSSTIRKYEKGVVSASNIPTLQIFAKALKVSIYYFIPLDDLDLNDSKEAKMHELLQAVSPIDNPEHIDALIHVAKIIKRE